MNRPRKRDRDLPPCVYLRHGAFYLVQNGKWRRLAADRATALREWARIVGQSSGSMPAFIDENLGRILRHKKTGKALAVETQRQYRACAALLSEMLKNLSPQDVTSRDVKDLRRGLQDTPAIANRAMTVLKLLLDVAVDDEMIVANPVVGVDRIKMAARTRRITPAEYASIHAHADPLLRAVMHLCYATGQRVMDVANIRSEHCTDEGVFFRQIKTGAQVIVAWTPELRSAVAEARALKPNALRPPFIFGFKPPTYAMIHKRWVKACKAARVDDANIHDLRAMSATDAQAQGINAQSLLGHTDAQTTRIYLRDKVVPVVPGPVMRRKSA